MLDEVDQARLHEDGNAMGQLINDGFEPGGAAWRVGGEKNERLDLFRVFTPVALCGIGRLPAATEDRCLRIVLVRKPVGRTTTRLDKAKKNHLRDLAPEILRWTQDSRKVLVQNLEPDFPADVENRSRRGSLASASGDRRHDRRRGAGAGAPRHAGAHRRWP